MSEKIGIVIDSCGDYPKGIVEKLGLHVLPVHIVVDGKDHLHGVNISNKEVNRNLKRMRKVHTTPYFPGECADFYEKLLERYDRIVAFSISTHLSGCYRSATNCLNLLYEDEARRIKIFDLGGVSLSLAMVVIKAIQLIRKYNTIDIEPYLERYIKEATMWATVDNLVWLKNGGRVSAFAAFVGGMLDIKPLISLEDAKLQPKEKHRGKITALRRIVELAEERYNELDGKANVWIGHCENLNEILRTREILAERIGLEPRKIPVVEVGATISVHTGPGSACVAMLPK